MFFFLVNDGYLKKYMRNLIFQKILIKKIATYPPLMHPVIVQRKELENGLESSVYLNQGCSFRCNSSLEMAIVFAGKLFFEN